MPKIDIINQIQNHNMKFLNGKLYTWRLQTCWFRVVHLVCTNLKFEPIWSLNQSCFWKCSGQNDMLEVLGVSMRFATEWQLEFWCWRLGMGQWEKCLSNLWPLVAWGRGPMDVHQGYGGGVSYSFWYNELCITFPQSHKCPGRTRIDPYDLYWHW